MDPPGGGVARAGGVFVPFFLPAPRNVRAMLLMWVDRQLERRLKTMANNYRINIPNRSKDEKRLKRPVSVVFFCKLVKARET